MHGIAAGIEHLRNQPRYMPWMMGGDAVKKACQNCILLIRIMNEVVERARGERAGQPYQPRIQYYDAKARDNLVLGRPICPNKACSKKAVEAFHCPGCLVQWHCSDSCRQQHWEESHRNQCTFFNTCALSSCLQEVRSYSKHLCTKCSSREYPNRIAPRYCSQLHRVQDTAHEQWCADPSSRGQEGRLRDWYDVQRRRSGWRIPDRQPDDLW
jgi:hypothetical protein